jgi:hypothetical protein
VIFSIFPTNPVIAFTSLVGQEKGDLLTKIIVAQSPGVDMKSDCSRSSAPRQSKN